MELLKRKPSNLTSFLVPLAFIPQPFSFQHLSLSQTIPQTLYFIHL